jgi:hypothetical protein
MLARVLSAAVNGIRDAFPVEVVLPFHSRFGHTNPVYEEMSVLRQRIRRRATDLRGGSEHPPIRHTSGWQGDGAERNPLSLERSPVWSGNFL